MLVNSQFDLSVLLDYGFEQIDNKDEDDFIGYEYKYEIGHSRRGQYYYILVGSSRELSIIATEPDGSGGAISFPDVIILLVKDGIVS